MELYEKIIRARKETGKSQEAVARETGISLRTYQQYERGNVKPKNRRALEKALALPIGYLEDRQMSAAEQAEYIKTNAHALMSDGSLSEVDLEAFINEMSEIMEDARKRTINAQKVK